MFYLGQVISYKPYATAPAKAVIVSGFSSLDAPLITRITDGGVIDKHVSGYSVDMSPIRQANKRSPTGYSIFMGSLVKIGFIGTGIKMKLPDDKVLLEVLNKAQKIIDQNK